jgi:hypothetical protein
MRIIRITLVYSIYHFINRYDIPIAAGKERMSQNHLWWAVESALNVPEDFPHHQKTGIEWWLNEDWFKVYFLYVYNHMFIIYMYISIYIYIQPNNWILGLIRIQGIWGFNTSIDLFLIPDESTWNNNTLVRAVTSPSQKISTSQGSQLSPRFSARIDAFVFKAGRSKVNDLPENLRVSYTPKMDGL